MFWEVPTRLAGFKAVSIKSDCVSKDRARLFPRTKVSPGNNKTRIKVRTGRMLLATGTCLSEKRGSKT